MEEEERNGKLKFVGERQSYPKDILDRFLSKYLPTIKENGNTALFITLGGSWSKGLANEQNSDFDLKLYYLQEFDNLISLTPQNFSDNNLTNGVKKEIIDEDLILLNPKENKLYYLLDNKYEFEFSTIPIHFGSGSKKLFPDLFKQKGFDILELLRNPLVWITSNQNLQIYYQEIVNFVSEKFYFNSKGLSDFFLGYLTHQINKEKYIKSFKKKEAISHSENSPYKIAKTLLEGIYIGLQGIAFFTDFTIYYQFLDLWKKYQSLFTPDQNQFIDLIYQFKITNCEQIDEIFHEDGEKKWGNFSLIELTEKIISFRREIFVILSSKLAEAMEESLFVPKVLSDQHNQLNALSLDRLFKKMLLYNNNE